MAFKPKSYKVVSIKRIGDDITYRFFINKLPYEVTISATTKLEHEETYEIIGGYYIPFTFYYSTRKNIINKIYLNHIKKQI